ncbi:hypothetical protein BAU07_06505 [Bordetella flabilis]|uniref:Phage tail assembly chaperone-like domain-containing protein n=1 Tax=Bordetella flabilis TaxID=463014 RepID=A0A193GKB7_9BORD|nr:hypothetical protein BAU07_06505 [Bordetella flabilis]
MQTILAQYLPLAYEAAQARRIRSDRNVRLRVADVLVNKANDLRDAERIAVAIAYRQGLRDVPGQPGFPKRVIWPEVPDAIVDLVPKSE